MSPERDGKDPFVLLSWGSHPGHLMPPRFSQRQFTLFSADPNKGARFDPSQLSDHAWLQGSSHDFVEAFRECKVAGDPDLVIVATDSMKHNQARNLAGFACPKLLLVGDTHHGPTPLASILSYATQEKFDYVALLYTRQHAHWFQAAGFERIAWMPGLAAKRFDAAEPASRPGAIGFVGQLGSVFPRRTKLIEAMTAAGLPIVPMIATGKSYEMTITAFPIGFNSSLNGDLNLRIFETIAAGALLITDELSLESGFRELLTPGEDCETYRSKAELIDLCRFYVTNLDQANAMAARGRARLASIPGLQDQPRRLVDWALGKPVSHLFDPLTDRRVAVSRRQERKLIARMSIYQSVQRRHVDREEVHVLLGAECPPALACDLMDLPRARIALERGRTDIADLLAEAGYADRFRWQDERATDKVDVWVTSSPDPRPGGDNVHVIDPRNPEATVGAEIKETAQRYREWNTAQFQPSAGRRRILGVRNASGMARLIANDDSSTEYLLKEIFEERCYKPVLAADDVATIADIGANQGFAAAHFRSEYPAARIVCFEPFPGAGKILAMNAVAIGNCEPMQYGLSDHDGIEMFYPGLTGSAVGSFSRGGLTQSNGIQLPVRSALDAFRECKLDAPDILKIDTEGSERPILDALRPVLGRVKALYVEFHSEADRRWIDEAMNKTHALWQGEITSADRGLLCYLRHDRAAARMRRAASSGLVIVPSKP
ncbi:MAG: FkbM family methyltransferase [Rhodospirillaceae bacterium]|nr:FkbM family methyltransferase [Rhodospirillaceae bacterium]